MCETGTSVCCIFGQSVSQEGSLQAVKALQDHLVDALGAELLDRWTVEVTYKLKQHKKKAMGSEMKFGVNVAAPFAGMKRDEGSAYPYAKQYCVRRSDLGTRLLVVQEMAKESTAPAPATATPRAADAEGVASRKFCEGMLVHVLEGGSELEASLASKTALVSRLKAVVDGHVYRLGDFFIRVGSCRKGAVYKGLVLEVEYMPTCRVVDGLAMITAFLPNVDESGRFIAASDLRDPLVFGRDPMYSRKHTALQTTDLFNRVFS